MAKRVLSKGSFLNEVWCAFVPGSQESCGYGMEIGDMIEATDEYQVYEAVDWMAFTDYKFKVKVYLDSEIQAEGNMLLGRSSDCLWDINGVTLNKSWVYEFVDGWDEYQRVFRDNSALSESTTNENNDDSSEEKTYLEYVDEETGDVYRIREDGTAEYQNEDGSYPSDHKLSVMKKKTKKAASSKGFAAVAGMEELKEQLRNEVLWPLKNKEVMEKYRLHPLNGMILYGPPGCGKTYIAQRFAEESGMNYKFVSAGSLGSSYIHQTASNVKDMFEDAKKQAPCILCIDEIDSLLPDRSQVGVEGGCSDLVESVNEFLSRMNNCSKDGIFVIGSTNNPLALDAAVLRTGRMDKVIYVGLPDEESRKALIEYNLKGRPQEDGIDVGELAKIADGMNASDIEFMVNYVATQAAMSQVLITFEKLAEQAKTQRRSVYIPKETESTETAKSTPANTRIMGFAQFDSSDVIKKEVNCA